MYTFLYLYFIYHLEITEEDESKCSEETESKKTTHDGQYG